jgi:hypothetical protein
MPLKLRKKKAVAKLLLLPPPPPLLLLLLPPLNVPPHLQPRDGPTWQPYCRTTWSPDLLDIIVRPEDQVSDITEPD